MPFHFNLRISKASILRSVAVLLPSCIILFYLAGLASQLFSNLHEWQQAGGYFNGEVKMQGLNFNPIVVFGQYSFTGTGLRFVGLILLLLFCISAYHYLGIRNNGGKYDERGFVISKSGTYGTARFMDRQELLSVLALQPPETADGIILGEYQHQLAVIPQDTYLNRHMMIFGSSGSGKSSTMIRNLIFSAIKNGQSVVVTDPKNELYRDTAVLFAQHGYKVRVFNLSDMQHSDSWNPMAELNRDAQRINTFVNVIFSNTENTGRGTDSYWANGEKALLSMLVKYLEYRDGTTDREHCLPALRDLMSTSKFLKIVAELKRNPRHPAYVDYDIIARSEGKIQSNLKHFIEGLAGRLNILNNPAARSILTENEIDLELPGKEKCAYFMILPTTDNSTQFISSLFFTFMIIRLVSLATAQTSGKLPIPVNLILDEFANIGTLGVDPDGRDFATVLSVVRGYDIRIMMALQSLGQLQNRYPKNLANELLGNTDIQILLGCNDDATAKYFSERAGSLTIQVESTRVQRSTFAVAEVIPTFTQTAGESGRKLCDPSELLRMRKIWGSKVMFVAISGHNMLKLNKFFYKRHPMAKQIKPADIKKYHTAEATTGVIPEFTSLPQYISAEQPPEERTQVPDQKTSLEEVSRAPAKEAPPVAETQPEYVPFPNYAEESGHYPWWGDESPLDVFYEEEESPPYGEEPPTEFMDYEDQIPPEDLPYDNEEYPPDYWDQADAEMGYSKPAYQEFDVPQWEEQKDATQPGPGDTKEEVTAEKTGEEKKPRKKRAAKPPESEAKESNAVAPEATSKLPATETEKDSSGDTGTENNLEAVMALIQADELEKKSRKAKKSSPKTPKTPAAPAITDQTATPDAPKPKKTRAAKPKTSSTDTAEPATPDTPKPKKARAAKPKTSSTDTAEPVIPTSPPPKKAKTEKPSSADAGNKENPLDTLIGSTADGQMFLEIFDNDSKDAENGKSDKE